MISGFDSSLDIFYAFLVEKRDDELNEFFFLLQRSKFDNAQYDNGMLHIT